jgi:hypothetical protein
VSGKNTPELEVTNISINGIWLLVKGRELFMAYDDFPWFKDASVSKVTKVQQPSPSHFYWPDLDVDVSLEIIEHPEKYPVEMQ